MIASMAAERWRDEAAPRSLQGQQLVVAVPRAATCYHRPRIQWAAILVALACCFSAVTAAASITTPPAPFETSPSDTILLDTRSPVMEDGHWTMISQEEHELKKLRRRASVASGTVTTTLDSVSIRTVTVAPTKTKGDDVSPDADPSADADPSTISSSRTLKLEPSTSATMPASPLPSPFDSSLASNFTGNDGNGACPAFINKFLTDPVFKQCYPFSMLLQVRFSRLPSSSSLSHDASVRHGANGQ